MAEAVTQDQTEFNMSAPDSPTQKRSLKRGPDSSPPEPRRVKRNAPAATMDHNDDSSAYVESAVEAAQAAAAAATAGAVGVTAADFTALQQATADHDSVDAANASSTAAAALGTLYPTIHVPQSTEEAFAAQAAANETDNRHHDGTFGAGDLIPADGLSTQQPAGVAPTALPQNGIRTSQPSYTANAGGVKPAVGSEEWHKARKDSHKEVERRRRETINEGINELAKIVPGCEKNKGSILQRAVSFITQLKDNEAQNIEKWTLEKLLTEQAIQELSGSNDKLKQELDRAYRELTLWKSLAQNAGLSLNQSKEDSTS